MGCFVQIWLALGLLLFCLAGGLAEGLSYDYSATLECLNEPPKPLYGGGVILNPEFDDGLEGWSAYSTGEVEHRQTKSGNKFAVSLGRKHSYDSISQKIYLDEAKFYTLSAWVQVSEEEADVVAVFKTAAGFIHAGGAVAAQPGCWSMLKGGIAVNISGPSELYFETQNASIEIWIDSVSLQPFTEQEWASHRAQTTEKARSRMVRIEAVDAQGNPMPNATVTIQRTSPQAVRGKPVGCAMSQQILTNPAYQNWFTSRFHLTTFENEMKWYSTERSQGQEDYSAADAMLAFASRHGISVRGHTVLWDDPQYQQQWVQSLPPPSLRAAAARRVASVMSRYRGRVVSWDVVNENLHFDFLEARLGRGASGEFYRAAKQVDPRTPLFLNDFNVLEDPRDPKSKPANYLSKLREIRRYVNGAHVGIGLEGHFHPWSVNIPYMRATLDVLASSRMPIWITELDVSSGPNQAGYLEQVLREAHAHPAVKGIVIWGARRPEGCYAMCLTDNNFRNLPTGDVVDRLLKEWGSSFAPTTNLSTVTTDSIGAYEVMLPHGDYRVTVTQKSGDTSVVETLNVAGAVSPAGADEQQEKIHIRIRG